MSERRTQKIVGAFVGLFLLLSLEGSLLHAKERAERVESLLSLLATPQATVDEKEEAEKEILKQETAAIPVLVNHLTDQRPSREIATNPPGVCLNPPPHQPLPKECLGPHRKTVTVGERAEELLYQIVTPIYRSPFAGGADAWKPGLESPFVVSNWEKWWEVHKGLTLAEIHGEAKILIDQFWKRGWDKGAILWETRLQQDPPPTVPPSHL